MPTPSSRREWRGRSGMTWLEAGDGEGAVVVYFHGTAKGKQEMLFPDAADRLGIRLLMADRPGYGTSRTDKRAPFAKFARMVLDDLDDEGVSELSMLGWSGGGPHALACAAIEPQRVRALGLLASWAPMNPPDPGLPLGVRFAMRFAASQPRRAVQAMLVAGRQGGAGMTDDVCRVARPWGFDLEHVVSAVRVIVWHAEGDEQVPVTPWRAVNGIELHALPGDSHEIPLDLWEVALRAVSAPA